MKYNLRFNSYLTYALLMVAVYVFLPTQAHALNLGNTTNNKGGNAEATANAGAVAGAAAGAQANNRNTNLNKQGQAQGQLQGQAQGQKQSTNNANNSSQNVNVEGDNFQAPEIPVATAYAPTINPTATCMGSSSGGGQGMNIGISFGTSWESENCMILETARSFEQAGHKVDAMAIRCTTKYAAAAPSCKALAKAANVTAVELPEGDAIKSSKIKYAEPEVVVKASQKPVTSPNGYYSVVTNPLAN